MSGRRQWVRSAGVAVDWVLVLGGMVAAQGFTALAVILLARRVAPIEYGQYVACYGLTALLVVVPGFGLDSWLLSRGATVDVLSPLWRSALGARLRMLALWIAGIALVGLLLPSQTFPPSILLLTAVGVGLESVSSLAYSALRNLGQHRAISTAQVFGGVTLVLATAFLPLESGGPTLFALSRMVVAAVVAALAAALAARRMPTGETPLATRQLLRAARPFFVGDLAVSVYMRADLTVVALFLGAAYAGIYGPALSLVNMAFLAPSALYSLVLPRLAALFASDKGAFHRFGARQLGVQAVTGVILAFSIYLSAPFIIHVVFGPAYASSGEMLRVLSPLLAAKCLSFGLGALLTSSQGQAWRSMIQVVAAVFNLAANLIVIVPLGLVGVAVVYIVSEVLLSAGYAAGIGRRWLAARARVPA